jgi:hypothetical protein
MCAKIHPARAEKSLTRRLRDQVTALIISTFIYGKTDARRFLFRKRISLRVKRPTYASLFDARGDGACDANAAGRY